MFGSVKAPFDKGGQPRSITQLMLEALRDHLSKSPPYISTRWRIFCGTNSFFKQPNQASAALLRPKAGSANTLIWPDATHSACISS